MLILSFGAKSRNSVVKSLANSARFFDSKAFGAQDDTRCGQCIPVDQMHKNAYYGVPNSASRQQPDARNSSVRLRPPLYCRGGLFIL
jgi:hypothetical protein